MSKKPIQPSLFRFVTLRSPQAIEGKEKKAGFILPSDDVKGTESQAALSSYYLAIDGVDQNSLTAKKNALNSVDLATAGSLLNSKTAIKALSENLYAFSSWLMRNRDTLSYDSIVSNINANVDYLSGSNDITLSSAQETQIWDNLIYQTINRTSLSIREALIQMLVANKFAEVFKSYHDDMTAGLQEGEIVLFTDNDEKEFRKRANASVVIEKEILLSNKLENNESQGEIPQSTKTYLQQNLDLTLAKERLRELKQLLSQLEKEEKAYEVENQNQYNTSLAQHKADILAAFDSEVPTPVDILDPETNTTVQIDTYPDIVVPEFNYIPLTIDFQESTGATFVRTTTNAPIYLSQESRDLLQNEEFTLYSEFESLKSAIQQHIDIDEDKILNASSSAAKKVSVGGSNVTINPSLVNNLNNYSFFGHLAHRLCSNVNHFTIHLNMMVGKDNLSATGSSLSLDSTFNTTSHNLTLPSLSLLDNDSKKIVYKIALPNDGVTDGVWNLSGSITFSNGDVINISANINFVAKPSSCYSVNSYSFTGQGILQGSSNTNDNDTVVTPEFNGVTNLGIADFRRVEQEVCCYVPGEVSHIENILAREYKEKSTRNLVSSETSTESSSEREAESLSDTTSTERNELQSEISTVLDNEHSQNFGASASVSGKFGDVSFGANTFGDTSSSSSSSISNSQAKNYAQEITERSLERVVQKVSTKRTSKVLREFEESNKHGFDNTKGTNHITGVYRWIDKIYTNNLVNYGKRLMYEFSIPEPAKFLKDALYLKDDTETTETELGLIVPKKPEYPNIDVLNLNAYNYQKIAAKYNAEVEPYPQDYSIGKSLKINILDRDKQKYATVQDEIEIPQGYKCRTASSTAQMMYHLRHPEFPKVITTIGDSSIEHNCKFGPTNSAGADLRATPRANHSLTKDYSSSIPIAALFSDTEQEAYANFVVNLTASQEGKAKWQNETYNAIMDAYYNRVQEYNDFVASQSTVDPQSNTEEERIRFNPLFNRSLERRELKRCAIELLTRPVDIQLAKNRYIEEQEVPVINADDSLTKDAAAIKFFEQAFDWEIMAYNFYPYYYSEPEKWKELVREQEDADPIFLAFLQSGMARVMVPIRPGFEQAVNWYQATGEIWNGRGLVTDMDDDLYLSIIEETLEPESEVEGTWETRVPTSLTMVQNKSAMLVEEGLPCNPDCGIENNTIQSSDLIISGGESSNASSGIGADTVGEDNDVV